ncbi:SusD/RagB family nutrient-binding outer membrane lipoprotein [Algivirga pacifica]|uniref:SusD/RagB family nutrient-binding outer membrane lipoprotein n=1 Tax=Algivirga pacifica TaxID=1162670 RepID=A0ABP9DI42_9BACT
MKKILVISALAASTLFATTSCDDYYKVNINPEQPVTAPAQYLLPPVLGFMSKSVYEHGEFAAYITQQVATLGGTDTRRDRWDYLNVNRIGHFRAHYHDVGINALHLIDKGIEEGNENYEGVGRLIFALSTQMTTDVFGDIPMTEAFQGNPSPVYDDQEQQVYPFILEELDLAITTLEKAKEEKDINAPLVDDIVYDGDLDKWIALAYAVKARTLLHYIPNVNADYDAVLQAIAKAEEFGFTTAAYNYGVVENGNDYQKSMWGRSQTKPEWDYWANVLGGSAPTQFFLFQLMGYDPLTADFKDPRLPYLMTSRAEAEFDVAGTMTMRPVYHAVRSGEGMDGNIDPLEYPDLYGNYQTRDDGAHYYFMEEELHFIKAEVLFLKKQYGEALSAMNEGVKAHMDRAGVPVDEQNAFMASDEYPQDAAAITLSFIMQQKMIALYLQGEVWVDMRRHGFSTDVYPNLERPVRLAVYWEAETSDNVWLQRFPYDPETEQIYNKEELEKRGAYQNPAWMYQPMFWAKKIDF